MIKSELIAKIAERMTNLPETTVSKSINHILNQISESLINGRRIEIRGFGSFATRHRAERNAHNPKTGEKVVTTAKNTPHFKAGKELRERINNARHKHQIIDD